MHVDEGMIRPLRSAFIIRRIKETCLSSNRSDLEPSSATGSVSSGSIGVHCLPRGSPPNRVVIQTQGIEEPRLYPAER